MKKFIYGLMFAVLPAMAIAFASCDDNDKNLPDVDVTLNVENATVSDGTIYVLQGDTLNVTGINVKNNEPGKGAAVANVKYYIDGYYFGSSFMSPFPAYGITNADTPAGNYQLGISCTVLAVDKSIASGYLVYPIKVVASEAEMPAAPAVTSIDNVMSVNN